MYLWIDDVRKPPKDWVWATTYGSAQILIRRAFEEGEPIEDASFDHDLGKDPRTGYDLLLWVAENNYWPEKLSIHSANPVGSFNMQKVVERYGPYNKKYAYGRTPQGVIRGWFYTNE